MAPSLLSIGFVHLSLLSISIVLSWTVFSFLFWRSLRKWGIGEDAIFDLTFYATLAALVMARVGYVLTHGEIFAGKSAALMVALWVAPGLAWYWGLIGALAALVSLSRSYKVRLGLVLDALPYALPISILIGKIGSFMEGAELGKLTGWGVGVRYSGHEGLRHPVQLYDMVAVLLLSVLMIRIGKTAVKKKWAYGMVGIWYFLFYSISMFGLEFLKDSRVYWGNVTANQWMLIGIFAECIGVLYVRGGGREHMRPFARMIIGRITKGLTHVYATISRRHTGGTPKTS
jgi:prolipoprotein diacylglyceryltransferase